jgi:SAM-dependent methyltransferase
LADIHLKHGGVSFYRDHILPFLIAQAMRDPELVPYRRRTIAKAHGRVLEIGVGSGLNFPHYSSAVESLVALDPSAKLLTYAGREARRTGRAVALIEADVEDIPLAAASLDCVVSTWTLCSVPRLGRALAEIRRVLKPGGDFLFVEHGLSVDAHIQRWQRLLTPVWRRISGGCHLDRAIDRELMASGFSLVDIARGYATGPKVATFFYEGRARPV